jgi:DNA polymerase-3 subunit beta
VERDGVWRNKKHQKGRGGMRLILQRDQLNDALSTVSHALPANSTLPILLNIKLTVNNAIHPDQIKLAASDTLIYITKLVKCDIIRSVSFSLDSPGEDTSNDGNEKSEFSFLLPGKLFCQTVQKFSGKTVEIITGQDNGTQVLIKCGKSNFKLPTSPIEEYPLFEEPNGVMFNFPSGTVESLKKEVSKVAYIPDPKMLVPHLNSVCFDIKGDKLFLLGWSNNRFAIRNLPIQNETDRQFLAPVDYLKKMIDVAEGQLTFYVSEKKLFVTCKIAFSGDIMVSIPLNVNVDSYPVYQNYLKQKDNTTGAITVNSSDFLKLIERACLLGSWADFKMVETEGDDRALQVSNNGGESGLTGNFSEEMVIKNGKREGSDINLRLQIKQLVEFLKTVETEEVKINYSEQLKPVFLEAGDNLISAVAPMSRPVEIKAA